MKKTADETSEKKRLVKLAERDRQPSPNPRYEGPASAARAITRPRQPIQPPVRGHPSNIRCNPLSIGPSVRFSGGQVFSGWDSSCPVGEDRPPGVLPATVALDSLLLGQSTRSC